MFFKKIYIHSLIFFLCTSILCGGSLAKNLKMINATSPIKISAVEHPYFQTGRNTHASTHIELELYYEEPNRIVDEEDWFDQHGFDYPGPIEMFISDIPHSTSYGELKFLRLHNKQYYAVYETVYRLAEVKDIYDEGYQYTLVIFSTTSDTVIAFSLDELFPDILEMYWFDAVDNLVYFNATYNGYAEIRNNETGYLYCLDLKDNAIVWATQSLISSYRGFTLYQDHIITGYGFTAEPDFLYVIDRFNGDITQTTPIKTAHEYIIVEHDRCYVRTYNMNYVYTLRE